MLKRFAVQGESEPGSVPNSSRALKGAGLLGDLLLRRREQDGVESIRKKRGIKKKAES